jgi:hypothetical protein
MDNTQPIRAPNARQLLQSFGVAFLPTASLREARAYDSCRLLGGASRTAACKGDRVRYRLRRQRAWHQPHRPLTVISYETIGSFRPNKFGGKGGQYMGLIQFGPRERAQYGANSGQSYTEQMGAVVRYLKDRGVKPGMGIKDIYSAINAGRPGLYNASDRPGYTVSRHVREMLNSYHRRNAEKMLATLF